MATKIRELSVFFPTFNEEGNIKNTVLKAKKVLEEVADKWEILVVNDGSTDKTAEIAEALAKEDERVRLITQENKGYGGALKTGFSESKYEWVCFTDADGQFDFSEIKNFIPQMDSADLILGFRLNRADSVSRKIYTFIWGAIPRVLWNLNVRDYSCGFKLIKKAVYDAVLPLVGEQKVTQIELLVKAKRKGFKFAEVGVHHYSRVSGKPTGADLQVVLKSLSDLYKLWTKLK